MSGLLLHWQLWLSTYSVFSFSFFWSMFPSEIPKLLTDPPVRGFPTIWKLLLHKSLPRMGPHSLTLLSPFLSFIFFPTSFRRAWAACLGVWCSPLVFKCFVEVAQHSNDLLMNFWGRKWCPRPIPPPSYDCLPTNQFCILVLYPETLVSLVISFSEVSRLFVFYLFILVCVNFFRFFSYTR